MSTLHYSCALRRGVTASNEIGTCESPRRVTSDALELPFVRGSPRFSMEGPRQAEDPKVAQRKASITDISRVGFGVGRRSIIHFCDQAVDGGGSGSAAGAC